MLKDTKANKLFMIALVILLALGFVWVRGEVFRSKTIRDTEAIPFAKGDSFPFQRFPTRSSSRSIRSDLGLP